jgi:ABC-type sugar transport system permease subunit
VHARLVLTIAIAASMGLTSPIQAEKKIRLRVHRLPKRPAVGPWDKAFLEAFETFIREHPNVELATSTGITPPKNMSTAGELTRIAGGTAPDVFDTFLDRIGQYADQGFLQPLDDLLAKELERDPDFIKKRYIPNDVWKACFYKGHCYAMPWYYGNMTGFTFRKDLMRRSGIENPHAPEDWDELLYFAMKCTFQEKDQWGIFIREGRNASWEFSRFLLGAAGGQVVKQIKVCPKDKTRQEAEANDAIDACSKCAADLRGVEPQWRLTYASEAGVKALQFMKRLKWCRWVRSSRGEVFELPHVTDPDTSEPIYVTGPGVTTVTSPVTGKRYPVPTAKRTFRDPKTGEDLWGRKVYIGTVQMRDWGWEEFIDGKHVMRFDGINFFGLLRLTRAGIDPDNVGFGPTPPMHKGMPTYMQTGACVLALNSQVTDPRKIQAAWDHMKFMSGDYYGLVCKHFVEAGMGTFVGALKLKRFGFEAVYRQMGQGALERELEMLRTAKVPPMAPRLESVVTTEMNNVMDQVLKQDDGWTVDVREALAKNQATAQDRVMGRVDEATMDRRRTYAWIVFAVLLPLVVLMVVRNLRARSAGALTRTPQSSVGRGWRTHVLAWALLLPAVLTVVFWKYVPLVWGSAMAFLDFRIMTTSQWVGLDNFINAVHDPVFWCVMQNTFVYVGLTILLGFVAPIVLAVLLSEAGILSLPYRVTYYLPHVISPLVVAFLWKLMYLPTANGYLNSLLMDLGVVDGPFGWLHDKDMAMVCVIIPTVWAGMGAASLIYLAALKTVPEDLYEAIALDGGGIGHKIRYVMYPAIRGLIMINFVGAFIGGFHAMQNIFVMTGGGPMNATKVIGIEIWENAFLYLRFGYATAMAWILGVGLIYFTMVQLRVLKRMEFTTAGDTA